MARLLIRAALVSLTWTNPDSGSERAETRASRAGPESL